MIFPVRSKRGPFAAAGLAAAGLLVAVTGVGSSAVYAAEAAVDLGTARSFAVLAGSTVTNTGPSVITGDLGLSPGSAVTGSPQVVGTQHIRDAVAAQAQVDLTIAYNDAAGRSTTADVTGADLGGMTLVPGVYTASSAMGLTGAVTLDAQGDPEAMFVFQAGSTLTTASNSHVLLVNGASPCNVFWQVGSSATLGTGTTFVGTVMALTSATLGTGANVEGRILARNGAVTLDTNLISAAGCTTAITPPVPTVTPTSTPSGTPTSTQTSTPSGTPSGTPTSTPTGTPTATPTTPVTGHDGGAPSAGTSPSAPRSSSLITHTATTPSIPRGHPHTGMGGAAGPLWAPGS